MLIIVDTEKFKADKEKYNRNYCEYIKLNNTKHLNQLSKNFCEIKKDSTKQAYRKMLDDAMDQILKINLVLDELPIEIKPKKIYEEELEVVTKIKNGKDLKTKKESNKTVAIK